MFRTGNKGARGNRVPPILPYIEKIRPHQENEKPKFVSHIQKPKRQKKDDTNRLFFINA
jgi:hypothetical protein